MKTTENVQSASDAPVQPVTPGQILRAARERRGLHLAMLSMALKVPVHKLDALEKDNYEVFQGVVFLRTLALAVCRHLGIDAKPVLDGLPSLTSPLGHAPAQAARPVINAHSGRWDWAGMLRGKNTSMLVWSLAALMVLAVALLLWWPGRAPDAGAPVQATPDATAAALAQASESAPQMATAMPAEQRQTSASQPGPLPDVAKAPSAPASAPSAVAGQTHPHSDAPLVIRALADVWVSVRDNRGEVVLRRQLMAAETVKLHLAAPLFVYIGRADGAVVQWQGQTMDLQPYIQNNEVRLPIKP